MSELGEISVGVIGPGIAFQQLHLPQIGPRDNVTIKWLAGRDLERTQAASAAVAERGLDLPRVGTDYRALLADDPVDAVLVTVPIPDTEGTVAAVLDHDVHVFAEKPIALNPGGARKLLDRALSAGRVLLAGENFRYQKRFHEFRRLVESGVVGSPKLYFLNDLHFTPADGLYAKTSWRQQGDHSGGYIMDGGTHIIAGLRTMVGSPVVAVHAVGTAVHPEYLSGQWDTLLINIRFANGLIGHAALGYGVHDKESRTPKVYGTEGTLALTGSGIDLWTAEGATTLAGTDRKDAGFAAEWDLFLAAVAGDQTARKTARDDTVESINDLSVLEAALTSARTGQAVNLL